MKRMSRMPLISYDRVHDLPWDVPRGVSVY